MSSSLDYALGIVDGTALFIAPETVYPDDTERVTPPSQTRPEPFSVEFDRGDGSKAGHGFPTVVWKWRVLTPREMKLLLGLLTVSSVRRKSRLVYLRTPNPDFTDFEYYTAWMHRPTGLSDKKDTNGMYFDVEFMFTMLEAYTPS